MSRAVVVSTSGDPFLLYFWYLSYKKFWREEVDRVYITGSTPAKGEILDSLKFICSLDSKIIFLHNQVKETKILTIPGLLAELENAYLQAPEDYMGLLEDDLCVFRSKVIDQQFRFLESNQFELVACQRSVGVIELQTHLATKGYPIDGIWPSWVFCRTNLLRQISIEWAPVLKSLPGGNVLGATTYPKGTVFAPFDYTLKETFGEEAFGIAGALLGKRVSRVLKVDMNSHRMQREHRIAALDWIHFGGLAGDNGIYSVLRNPDLQSPLLEPAPRYQNVDYISRAVCSGSTMEWERRAGNFLAFAQAWNLPILKSFHQKYIESIDRLIDHWKLSRSSVEKFANLFLGLL